MACIASSRLCTRAERLCQFGHFAQLRKKVTTTATAASTSATTCAKSRTAASSRTCETFLQRCQSKTNVPDNSTNLVRAMSTIQPQMPGVLCDDHVDLYKLLHDDFKDIFKDMQTELINNTTLEELRVISTYYMHGGKAFRPMLIMLMARAINFHKGSNVLLHSQRQTAMIIEMIHSASLLHDDVIDMSDTRRGKPSGNVLWNQKKVTMAGDYILAVVCMMLAKMQNNEVTLTISQVVADLVQGEFMQLGCKETENERFAHYFLKTYRKTASTMANCCKAVALLADVEEHMVELAFQYGRNLGLAFQVVDDFLDFVSTSEIIGKPAATDLKIGLATAPVLFACEQYPELNAMIMRQFQEPGDVERAYELVHKSNGLEQTKFMAKKHCVEASRIAQSIVESPFQKGLLTLCDFVANRAK